MFVDLMDDGWLPVALGRDVEKGASAGAVVNGQDIVIWRDKSGQVHIWEDRCPHRGMKLSFGFVRDDHIACLYHGWEFGPSGKCHRIPAHPELDVPPSICTKTYAAAEVAGLIWVAADFERTTSDTYGHAQIVSQSSNLRSDFDLVALRSIYIDAPLVDICDGIAGIFRGSVVNKGAYLLVEADHLHLLFGLQPVSNQCSAVHIVVLGQPDVTMSKTLLQKIQILRLSLEQGEVV